MKNIPSYCLKILCVVWLLHTAASCRDYDSGYSGAEVAPVRYSGTVLEFLTDRDNGLGFTFDSLTTIIRGIPGMEQQWGGGGKQITVFAIPDPCFTASLYTMNRYRHSLSDRETIYESISYRNLLIEPFQTEIEKPNPEDPATPLADTLTFDYRKQLGELLCRYIFEGLYDSQTIQEQGGGVKINGLQYDYGMHAGFARDAASGVENTGVRRMTFSDTNGSQLQSIWNTSPVAVFDIFTDNGVIHILDTGHEFSFNKLIPNFYNYGHEEGERIYPEEEEI